MDDGIRVGGGMPPPPALMEALSNGAKTRVSPPPVRQPPVRMAPRPPDHILGMVGRDQDPGGYDEDDDDGDDAEEGGYEDFEEGEEELDEEEEEEETPEQAARRALLEEEQKAAMLARIAKIKSVHRMTGPCMSRHSSVEDVRFELRRLEDELVLRQSVKVQRRMLMAAASGLEFVHHKTPARGKLTGWSESIMASIDDYDDVFDRLHRKHAPKLGFGKGKRTEPEVELAMMVGYSAFSFALANTMTNLGKPTPTQQAGGAAPGFSASQYKQRAAEMDFKAEEAKLGAISSSSAVAAAAATAPSKAVTFSTTGTGGGRK